MKLHAIRSALLLATAIGIHGVAQAQDGPLTVETLDEAAPEELAAPIKEVLGPQAIRVLDGQGDAFADFWLRVGLPVTKQPAGPEGAVLLPAIQVGQLVGVVRFREEAYDYRDQPIEPGVYSLRYGLLPVNGDHLGVSTYRDYLLLVPGQDETDLELIDQATLEVISADAAMTNHPAVFLLTSAPEGSDSPSPIHNEANDQWGVALPLSIQVPGEDEPATHTVQLILVGRGPI